MTTVCGQDDDSLSGELHFARLKSSSGGELKQRGLPLSGGSHGTPGAKVKLSSSSRDLTRILKIAVQDSSFMKSCSPRQNFAVPVYKHEYLSLIFVNRKKWIFIIVLYCGGTAPHTLLLY